MRAVVYTYHHLFFDCHITGGRLDRVVTLAHWHSSLSDPFNWILLSSACDLLYVQKVLEPLGVCFFFVIGGNPK